MLKYIDQYVQAINFGMIKEKELVQLIRQQSYNVKALKKYNNLTKVQRLLVIIDSVVLELEKEQDCCKEQIDIKGFTKISNV